jgi:hypothetical protein
MALQQLEKKPVPPGQTALAIAINNQMEGHQGNNDRTISRIRDCLSHNTCLHHTLHLAQHIISFLEEPVEGTLIGYGWYMLLSYNPNNMTEFGYILLAGGATFGAVVELMKLKKRITHQDYETYRVIKQAIAGGLDGANFLQSFMKPNNQGVAGGMGVCVALASIKTVVELYRDRPIFHSRIGKSVNYIADAIFNLAMGAGIAALLFQLILGFNTNYVPPSIIWLTTAAIAAISLIANIVKQYYRNEVEVPRSYRVATITTALLYGAFLAFIFLIAELDIVDDIKPNNIFKDYQFGLVIAAAALFGTLVAVKKMILDIKEERHHQQMSYQSELGHPIHYRAPAEDVELGAEDLTQESSCTDQCPNIFSPVKRCVASFWHSNNEQRIEGYEQIIDEQSEGICSRIARTAYSCWPVKQSAHYAAVSADADDDNGLLTMRRA